MTDLVHPPIRILPTPGSTTPITEKQTLKNISSFLSEYTQRPGGTDSSIQTRLERLTASLQASERGRKKKDGKEREKEKGNEDEDDEEGEEENWG